MSTPSAILDVSNLNCPVPVLKLKKQLKGLKAGSRLIVTGLNDESQRDILRYCHLKSHRAVLGGAPENNHIEIFVGGSLTC